MIFPQPTKVLATLSIIEACRAVSAICPPTGPWLPQPTALGQFHSFRSATENLERQIKSALKGEIEAGWPVANASFSISVVSSDDLEDGRPLWEYHHLAEANINGTKQVDGDSQYLIGSVSKLISELVFLKAGIDMDEKITEFLPELDDDSSFIKWNQISLNSLATHLSGMPPNYGFSEYYYLKDVFEELGLPHIEETDYLNCEVIALNSACTRDQLLKNMVNFRPVVAPNTRPVYSTISFTLMSYAVQVHTGKNFTQLLQEYLIEPLSLTNFGASPGDDTKAVIPPGDNSWGSDYADNAPGGGLFSSSNDLSRILHGIIKKTILPKPSDVDGWLKPHSVTTDSYMSTGAPWEIFRLKNAISDHDVDVYSKGGGAYGYTSHVGVVPDYGIGISILTAGPGVSLNVLMDAVYSTILPAVDAAAISQAKQYTGTYSSSSKYQSTFTTTPTKLIIAQDDLPGLRIAALTRNGTDILRSIQEIWNMTIPTVGKLSLPHGFRIFPAAGISEPISANNTIATSYMTEANLVREDWRINFDIDRADPSNSLPSELPGRGTFDGFCGSWQTADWIYYGGQAIDRVVFVKDRNTGKVVEAEVPFLRAVVEKA